MSTHALIGIVNADETVTAIYVHFDGQPNYMQPMLFNHYSDVNKIRALLDLGDLSSIGQEIDGTESEKKDGDKVCRAYGRDMGEKGTQAKTYWNEFMFFYERKNKKYHYLFKNGEWHCGRKTFRMIFEESDLLVKM